MRRTERFYGRDDRGSARTTSTAWMRGCRFVVGAAGLVLGLGVLQLVCLATSGFGDGRVHVQQLRHRRAPTTHVPRKPQLLVRL